MSTEEGTAQDTATTCTFIKPRRPKGNLRKRATPEDSQEEQEETQVVRKQQKGPTPVLGGSTKNRERATTYEKYDSSGSVVPWGGPDQKATAAAETETEFDKDATAIEDRHRELQEILAGEDAERAEKIYRGLHGYKDYIETKKLSGLSKGTGIKAGPVRALVNIRHSARFDYQPDVCKDYKETGYCGYGDSCKFLHDRTDYKSGWELEKEWEEELQKKKMGVVEDYEVKEEEEDDIPFACAICRQGFVNPVSTRCKHYFCEKCALNRFKKDMKCAICGENTYGAFSVVPQKIRERMEKKREEALARGDFAQQGDDEENEGEDPAEEQENETAEETTQ